MEDVTASADDAGLRLDQFLVRATGGALSRSRIQSLIADGHVRLNGTAVRQSKRRVEPGDHAQLDLPEPTDPEPKAEAIPLSVLYEDDDLIVIDKPAGLVVHPGAGNPTGTLVNALIHHCGDTLSGIGGVKRPGIVHRLDKDTSGVMVVAKTDAAHTHLSAQFADHGKTGAMRRVYAALVWGAPNRNKGTIETFLGRASVGRTKQAVVSQTQPDARNAVTRYQIVERLGGSDDPVASLVDCTLETGRTHQIRVHMAHIGHPLLGDGTYGAGFKSKANTLPDAARTALDTLGRQALHARQLAFEHPHDGQVMTFVSPLPADMDALVSILRKR